MTRMVSGSAGGVSAATLDRLLVTGPVRQRIAPDGANAFHLVARNDRGTAFAHRFARNVGGSDPVDTGAPWSAWRYVGTAEIAGFDASPTDPARFVYSDDLGAQDYAFQLSANGLYAGSYHGGTTLNAEGVHLDGVAIDPTVPANGSQLVVRHGATITSGGNVITLEFTVTVRSFDGTLAFHCAAASSGAVMSRVFIGMVIGNGPYDEAKVRLHGGATDLAVPVPIGTTYLGGVRGATMRRADTGRAIRVVANMAQSPTFRRAKIVRTPQRAKLYFEGATGVMGTKVNLVWSLAFDRGTPGVTGVGAGPNLLANGDFVGGLAGWTSTHVSTGGGIAAGTGNARMIRGTSGDNRLIQGVATGVGAVYLLSGEDTTSGGAAGSLGLTSAVNGSTATPPPAYAPVMGEAGYTAHLVVATQPTSYAMLVQFPGTAGQTTDFDNVSLVKLGDAA